MTRNTVETPEDINLDLGKYLLIVKRQAIPAICVFFGTVGLSFLATTFIKPSYQADGRLLFKKPSFQLIGTDLIPNSHQSLSDLKSLVSTQNPIVTQKEVFYSPAILQKTIDKLELKDKEGEPLSVNDLAKSLSLKIVGGTDVLRVSYESRNPEETAAIVNTVMESYLENNTVTTRLEAEATYNYIGRQIPKTASQLKFAELALRNFQQEHNTVDLSSETASTASAISSIKRDIYSTQTQLDLINTQIASINQKINVSSQQALTVSSLNNSSSVQSIMTQIQEIDRQLALERSRYFDSHPVIVDLIAKKRTLNNLLETEIQQTIGSNNIVSQRFLQIGQFREKLTQDLVQLDIQRQSLETKVISLGNTLRVYESEAKNLPIFLQQERELKRKVELAQNTYETIVKKAQELELAQNQSTPNARIIALAKVPEKPLSSKKPVVIVLGVLSGIFCASLIMVLLEMRDRTLKTVQEIKQKYDYNLLGILPLLTHKKKAKNNADNPEFIYPDLTVINAPESPISEKYRMIQANLKSLNADKPLDTIVVTSAMTGEGKSTFTANLGASISQLGKRVLIIDADMRTPSQHNIWKVPNELGLSSVLLGEKDFYNSGQHITDNLDILTSGHQTANPLALIDSQQMPLLISELQSQYDMIIIDAPSFMATADAFTLGRMSDGVLLVARPGFIDYDVATAGQEILKQSGQNILGVIVNGLIKANEPNNHLVENYQDYLKNQDVSNKQIFKK
ncbi:MAG: polysaccharide biosynthesis tyrosine autokinase [Sphaerospermopsis sp. SIO1G1]|nr:polysaccharide biosynthesis tyrosine autokinase [Sphaerospermopsis sp. SIO1G1]